MIGVLGLGQEKEKRRRTDKVVIEKDEGEVRRTVHAKLWSTSFALRSSSSCRDFIKYASPR